MTSVMVANICSHSEVDDCPKKSEMHFSKGLLILITATNEANIDMRRPFLWLISSHSMWYLKS